MKTLLHLAAAVLAPLLFTSCAKKDPHAGHDHSAAKHVHVAPHGGTLVELGEHAFNLEFVRDASAGKLTAYLLDGHAENFVRIYAASFEVAVKGTPPRTLTFKSVANPATGETVGDSSQFEAQADWLKNTATFTAMLTSLEIRGTTFSSVAFNFPKGNEPH